MLRRGSSWSQVQHATGCSRATNLFYAEPKLELERMVGFACAVEPAFLAKAAIHAREAGHMKDMPAVLLAVLSSVDTELFRTAFDRVVTDGRMLRTFVQVMRSGAAGRKSLGTRPKAMVADWLNGASDRALLKASVFNDPSLADVIKMVHPKPASPEREAFFAWAVGKPCYVALLPEPLRAWLAFKATGAGEVPDVPFQMLTHLPLTADQWAGIARGGSWQMLRQNLNTFARHGVFEREEMVRHVAAVLRDPERRATRVFPYQLMIAAAAVGEGVPEAMRDALHDSMEVAIEAVPRFDGTVAVCPDVSGSMASPVTGHRKGATSRVRFVDVAALVTAAVMRKNEGASCCRSTRRCGRSGSSGVTRCSPTRGGSPRSQGTGPASRRRSRGWSTGGWRRTSSSSCRTTSRGWTPGPPAARS